MQIADHKLLKELSIRFERQQRRWNSYSQLCGFFFIVVLLLSVLWMQRGAQVGFQVHKTVRMNIVDSFQYSRFNSPTEILNWLELLADEHWVDPPCGDGKCDQPFEFPSYSRFGCRADCSALSLVSLDVHPLQVDLYFDFLHSTDGSVVSLAPTALLDLASWNVCPVNAPHGALGAIMLSLTCVMLISECVRDGINLSQATCGACYAVCCHCQASMPVLFSLAVLVMAAKTTAPLIEIRFMPLTASRLISYPHDCLVSGLLLTPPVCLVQEQRACLQQTRSSHL